MIGQTILHFQILEKLGEGGMGVVYKARDTRLERTVALKFLPQHVTGTAEERARFTHEARAAATLNHPNVCTIYGIEEHGGQQFIEMEYVEGVTLRARISSSAISSQDAITFAIQIGDALREAHGKGIVHRDVKSENIMVTSKGQVKVMDFGLAKLKGASHLTKSSSTVGTLAYMAPEQIQGGEVDARSDIFSFGVLLFEMLTGRLPFRGEHEAAMMYSILNEEPLALSGIRPGLDAELERIIQRALEKDPEDRYQHVDDMMSELRRLQKKTARITRPVPVQGPAQDSAGASAGVPQEAEGQTKTRPAGLGSRLVWIAAVAVVVLGALVGGYVLLRAPTGSIRSMAVLPFENQSKDPELEFLSDGFTETLINRLSRLPGVTMMSRSSVFRFKGKDIDPVDAGTSLGVQAVLTGRILQRNNRISVAVELVDVRDRSHIWGEQYQRPAAEALAVQTEIAQEISRQLRVTLSGEQADALTHSATRNNEAYELYLKGRFHWNRRTPEGLKASVDYFRQAIELDPDFALAYSGLADSYGVMANYYILPPGEAAEKALAAARKALELDPTMAEPYVILAVIYAEYDWDWNKGEEYYKRAIALNPNYATAHQWYAETMWAMGRSDESIERLTRAQELDPLSPIIATSLGNAYGFTGRYLEAREQLKKALELDPAFPRALLTRGMVRYLEGDTPGAVEEMRRLMESSGGQLEVRAALAFLLGRNGNLQEAAALTDELHREARGKYVSPYLFAVCYTGMGNRDEAFRWLEKGLQERSTGLVYMKGDPFLRPLHSDPRFNTIVTAMGLPPLPEQQG